MPPTDISAAEAVKLFRDQSITVQTAKKVRVKDKESGKERDAFETKDVALRADHVLAAVRLESGAVRIVTIDGRRYEAAGKAE